MRLAFVSHSPWLGGAERCLLELTARLSARSDVEVDVVLPGDGPLGPALQRAGARTFLAPSRWWAADPGGVAPRVDPDGARAVGAVLAARRPDLVVSSTLVQPAGAFAADRLRLAHLWWVHEFGQADHGFRFALGLRATLRLVGRLSRRVVTGSEAVAEMLTGAMAPRRVAVVPYGIETARAPAPAGPREPGRPARLLVAGRVRPSKGQDEAVEALARLRAGAELDLVGDGTPEDVAAVRAHAASLGVGDRVHVHGPQDDVTPWLDRADVVLMCSRREAFGRVTAEALRRGRPVVGAASGGTPELLDRGRAGVLYPAGDAAALAGEVDALLADDGRRRAVAAAGWRHAGRAYDPERQAQRFLAEAARAAGSAGSA